MGFVALEPSMNARPLRYVLIGNKGTCPDMVRMWFKGDRWSLYRDPGESEQQFSDRVQAVAQGIADRAFATVYFPLSLPVQCYYDVPYLDAKAAAKTDSLWSLKQKLTKVLDESLSQPARFKAACRLADLTWPGLRKGLH